MSAEMENNVSLERANSEEFGTGASAYSLDCLKEWKCVGVQAEIALRAGDWAEADRLAAMFCDLRPDWPRGYMLRRRTMIRAGYSINNVSNMLHRGISHSAASSDIERMKDILNSLPKHTLDTPGVNALVETDSAEGKVEFKSKVKGLKLLSHELVLVQTGKLVDVTHDGSSSIWLSAKSARPTDGSYTQVYRPMGDEECGHLLEHGVLPDTQPYQTIVEGEGGRVYAEKYLRGHKSVDSSPTTVVEFAAPHSLVKRMFAMQSKNEDGAISHGLGDKGGRGLPLFNASLQSGETTFRIVFVKRFVKKAAGAFGASRRRL